MGLGESYHPLQRQTRIFPRAEQMAQRRFRWKHCLGDATHRWALEELGLSQNHPRRPGATPQRITCPYGHQDTWYQDDAGCHTHARRQTPQRSGTSPWGNAHLAGAGTCRIGNLYTNLDHPSAWKQTHGLLDASKESPFSSLSPVQSLQATEARALRGLQAKTLSPAQVLLEDVVGHQDVLGGI